MGNIRSVPSHICVSESANAHTSWLPLLLIGANLYLYCKASEESATARSIFRFALYNVQRLS